MGVQKLFIMTIQIERSLKKQHYGVYAFTAAI